jgi:RHS repeat-associated protein
VTERDSPERDEAGAQGGHWEAFISYSHEDDVFVARLHQALKGHGTKVWVDEEDIPPASRWADDLKLAIESSDSLVFVVSPDSIVSRECMKELEYAASLNKRIIPLIARRTDLAQLPKPLSAHQYVPQRGVFDDDLDRSLELLITAIETDLDWVRAHTKWGAKAIEWDQHARDRSFLLSGSELEAAEQYLASGSGRQPKPSELQTAYVLISRQRATRFLYYKIGKAPGKYCTSAQQATIVRDPDWTKPAKEEEGEKFKLAAHETLYCANVLDEVEKTLDAEGHETTATYDPIGNPTSITAPARETGASRGVTTFIYGIGEQNLHCEVQGEPVTTCPETELDHGYATEAKYEDTTYMFQPNESISERRETTSLCYYGGTAPNCESTKKAGEPDSGALRQETEPNTAKSTMYDSYEPDGNLSSATDFDGHTTSYEYEAGNLKTVIPPSGSGLGKETITVDGDDRPHIIVQCLVAEGSCTSSDTTTLTYSPLDQITEAVYTGPGATKTIKYTYNADGGLEKMVDPTGTTTYTLDALGRVTEEALPGSVSNAYTYDEASNLASFTDAGGTTHYAYNGLNELESMYEPGGTCTGTPSKCTQFTYDNDGSLLKTTYASGASMRYKLDPTTGRILTAEANGTKGETLLSNTYEYVESGHDNPLILRDSFSGPGGVTAETKYSYSEGVDRLTEALSKSATASYKSCYQYYYDPVGNMRRAESTPASEACKGNDIEGIYNAGNQLECRMKAPAEECSKSSSTEISGYTHDGAGDETAITEYDEPKEPATTSFGYNNLKQLESLTPPEKGEEKLKYLGSGQAKLTGLGTTTLQNSALGITKQTIGGNASYYARTPGGTLIDERVPGSISYNPIYDAQGDIVGLLNSSGELVQTIRYGPYGENTNATKIGEHGVEYSPTNDPFLFQGGYHIAEGGNAGVGNVPNHLYHFGERDYDPTTGRWTQPDPQGGLTEFAFAGDDPVNEVDPSGERAIGADNEVEFCAAASRQALYKKAPHSKFWKEQLDDCIEYERIYAEYQERIKPLYEQCGLICAAPKR